SRRRHSCGNRQRCHRGRNSFAGDWVLQKGNLKNWRSRPHGFSSTLTSERISLLRCMSLSLARLGPRAKSSFRAAVRGIADISAPEASRSASRTLGSAQEGLVLDELDG